MRKSKWIRFIEFLLIGVCFGVIEDLIAILLATGERLSWKILLIAVVVAVPFAFVSEIVVDHPDFWKRLLPKSWFNAHE